MFNAFFMLCLIPDDKVKDERLNLNLPSEVKQAGCLTVNITLETLIM